MRTFIRFVEAGLFGLSVVLLPMAGFAAPGNLDPTFSGDGKLTDWLSRGDDWGHDVAIQQDGKIVVAASSSSGIIDFDAGRYDFEVVRYNVDGSLDQTFGNGGKVTTDFNSTEDRASSVAIQQDGKIVVAGTSINETGIVRFALVRYNSDGSLDPSFGNGGKVTTEFTSPSCYLGSVAIQADDRIVAAGTCGGPALSRYNPDGSLDPTFDSDGRVLTAVEGSIRSIAIQANGKIVAAGTSHPYLGTNRLAVFRYNADGSIDASFDGDGMVIPPPFDSNGVSGGSGVAIQSDGSIVAVGTAILISGAHRVVFTRFNPNGTFNGSLAVNINGWDGADSVTIQADGKIVAAGSSSNLFPPYGPSNIAVVRLNANFSRDLTFGNNGVVTTPIGPSPHRAISVAIQPDGKIVGVGNSDDSFNSDIAVIRYNTNGSLDTSFDDDGKLITDFGRPLSNVFAHTAIQPDGKIVASGTARGVSVLARYLSDGSPDTTFGVGNGKATYSGSTGPVAIDPEGRIIAAGLIYDDYEQGHFTVFRYTADGSVDTTFGTGGSSRVVLNGGVALNDMLIQQDGKIVVAGSNNGRFTIARINSNGSIDTSFDGDGIVFTSISSSSGDAKSVALQPDGKIVATGSSRDSSVSYFTTVRYNTNGTLDTSFDGDGIVRTRMLSDDFADEDGSAEDVAVQSDGKIIVAGCTSTGFEVFCDTFSLARYNPNGSLDTTFDGDGRVLTYFGGGQAVNVAHLRSIAIESDGKIVAAGDSEDGPNTDFTVVRYRSDGSLDTAFGDDGISTVDFNNSVDLAKAMTLDAQGRAVVVGESGGAFAIARVLLRSGISLTGRVTTLSGQGLRNATVVLTDAQGNVRIALTSSFGIYSFEGIPVGQNYTLTVRSKRYRFAPRTLDITGSLTGVDLVGQE